MSALLRLLARAAPRPARFTRATCATLISLLLISGAVRADVPQRASFGVSAVILAACRISSDNASPAPQGANAAVGSSCNVNAPVKAYPFQAPQANPSAGQEAVRLNVATSNNGADARVLRYVLDY